MVVQFFSFILFRVLVPAGYVKSYVAVFGRKSYVAVFGRKIFRPYKQMSRGLITNH